MERRNRLEWVILAVSVVAIGGVVGVLVLAGLTDRGRPPVPIVRFELDRAYLTSTGWILPATATNEGDRSAQAVTLLATAIVGGDEEEAEVTIDYLPAGSDVDVAFGFSGKPDGEVRVRVSGFLL